MTELKIKNLKTYMTLGVFDWERAAPREVILNISLRYDGAKAALSDALADTIDYGELEQSILGHLKSGHFYLIERVAHEIGELIMKHRQVEEVTVEVNKPHALTHADSVSVTEIFRR